MRSPHPAEGMYGSLRHLVKPILEKISVATRTWTASLKHTNSSLVPTSLKTWYPRSLLLTPSCGVFRVAVVLKHAHHEQVSPSRHTGRTRRMARATASK